MKEAKENLIKNAIEEINKREEKVLFNFDKIFVSSIKLPLKI